MRNCLIKDTWCVVMTIFATGLCFDKYLVVLLQSHLVVTEDNIRTALFFCFCVLFHCGLSKSTETTIFLVTLV